MTVMLARERYNICGSTRGYWYHQTSYQSTTLFWHIFTNIDLNLIVWLYHQLFDIMHHRMIYRASCQLVTNNIYHFYTCNNLCITNTYSILYIKLYLATIPDPLMTALATLFPGFEAVVLLRVIASCAALRGNSDWVPKFVRPSSVHPTATWAHARGAKKPWRLIWLRWRLWPSSPVAESYGPSHDWVQIMVAPYSVSWTWPITSRSNVQE